MVTAARLAGVIGIVALAIGMRVAVACDFDIEAGNATQTLNEFSRQSDLQILFDFKVLEPLRTRSIRGELKPTDALTQMLAGTGLVFDFVNDRTLAVTPSVRTPEPPVDSNTFARWMRRFEATAQVWAEGAAPAVKPLIVEIVLTNEIYTAAR